MKLNTIHNTIFMLKHSSLYFLNEHTIKASPQNPFFYLWHHIFHELLSSKPRFYSHNQGHIYLISPRCQILNCSSRFDGKANLQQKQIYIILAVTSVLIIVAFQ